MRRIIVAIGIVALILSVSGTKYFSGTPTGNTSVAVAAAEIKAPQTIPVSISPAAPVAPEAAGSSPATPVPTQHPVTTTSATPGAHSPAPTASAPADGSNKGGKNDLWSLLKDPTISLLLWIIAALFAVWLLGRWAKAKNEPYRPQGRSDDEFDEMGYPRNRRTPRIGDEPSHSDFDDWRNDFTGITGGGNPKSPAQLILPNSPDRRTFADVAGQPVAINRLREICEWLKEPDVYNRHDAKLPHGILLVGPPGTGKTLLARALAGEADASMFITTGSSFVEMYVGVGASRVRALFDDARNQRKRTGKPVIIFIDEIDAVGGARSSSANSNSEREQTLNQLLTEVDGFKQNEGIIVLAATNRSDMLDQALRRKGRFDQEIMVDLPDAGGREAIFKVHSRKKTLAPDVDFSLIARRTFGFNGADIEAACNEAAVIAARRQAAIEKAERAEAEKAAAEKAAAEKASAGVDTRSNGRSGSPQDQASQTPTDLPARPVETRVIPITNEIFDEAISVVEAGEARHDRLKAMSQDDKLQTAYHELGHAVVTIALKGDPITKITILPRGRALGYVQTHTENDRWNMTKEQLLSRISMAMAGRLAQEIFMNTCDTGATSDFQQANDMARKMVTQYGMSKLGRIYVPDGSAAASAVGPALSDAIDGETRAIVAECEERARAVIESHRAAIEALCAVLIEKETLLGPDLMTRFNEFVKID